MSSLVRLILAILIICFLLLIGPWLFIWAINTLIIATGLVPALPIGSSAIGAPIAFSFWTWLAAVLVGGFSIIPRYRRK